MRLEAKEARKRIETVTSASYLGTAHDVPVCGGKWTEVRVHTEGKGVACAVSVPVCLSVCLPAFRACLCDCSAHSPEALRSSQTAVAKVLRCGWNSSSYLVAYRFTFSTWLGVCACVHLPCHVSTIQSKVV
jgi:hypothetical protein